jgi:hypothetical protein
MVKYSAYSVSNMTARILRAVCFLSMASLAVGAWAEDHVSLQNPATQPPITTTTINKSAPSAKLPSKTAAAKPVKPLWSDLTPAQQQALAPLSSDWDKIDTLRKEKWLEIAKKFPGLKPEEQQRVQERMREWAKLTPAQRRAARESYARTKKLNADQKSEKWQQYQNLPDEEKKRLAAEAENKKRVANLPRPNTNKNKTPASIKSVAKPVAQQPAASQTIPPQATPAPTLTPTK